jgi:hypothetical protein
VGVLAHLYDFILFAADPHLLRLLLPAPACPTGYHTFTHPATLPSCRLNRHYESPAATIKKALPPLQTLPPLQNPAAPTNPSGIQARAAARRGQAEKDAEAAAVADALRKKAEEGCDNCRRLKKKVRVGAYAAHY